MSLAALMCGVGLFVCTAAHTAQAPGGGTDGRPTRIISKRYGFSVVFPRGWYVYEGAHLPLFFNYSAEKALPQGRLRPGMAEIDFMDCLILREVATVPSCSEHEVVVNIGATPERKEISGPAAIGSPRALQFSYDQRQMGNMDRLHYVTVYWEYRGRVLGAELSYRMGDPSGSQYERVLLEIVQSFRPT